MLALLLACAPPAAAQPAQRPPLPGIGADDPRRPVEAEAAPWRALARVQTELGGRCSGVMIAPDQVLTAAHCLLSRRTGRRVRPGSVHVLLGYARGSWVATARATEFRAGPGHEGTGGPPGADWAVLTLERPIAEADRILKLRRDAPPPGTPAMLAGWQQDRPEVLLADADCRILGLAAMPSGPPALAHDCAGTRGASGAPLLAPAEDGTGWAVAGVASGVRASGGLGLAAPAASVAR